jgi:hypothetical protein
LQERIKQASMYVAQVKQRPLAGSAAQERTASKLTTLMSLADARLPDAIERMPRVTRCQRDSPLAACADASRT